MSVDKLQYGSSLYRQGLPQELIDSIVDQIPVDEQHTLRECTLVANSFYTRAHRRLFSTVILKSSRYTHHRQAFDPYGRFFQLVSRYPHDAALVTDLRLYDHSIPNSESWLASDEIIVPSILRLLPRLSSLSIHAFDTSLSRATLAAIRRIISTTALSSIHFHRVIFRHEPLSFGSLFASSTSLKNVSIHDGQIALGSTFGGAVTPNSLDIKMMPEAASGFVDCLLSSQCPFDLKALNSLTLSTTWMKNATIFNPLLGLVRDTLSELIIHTSNTSARPLQLGRIPRVKIYLTVHSEWPSMFFALAAMLAASESALEDVAISITGSGALVDVQHACVLDDVLRKVKRNVFIYVILSNPIHGNNKGVLENVEKTRRALKCLLPLTDATGTLKVDAGRMPIEL
ncbi:hypothetical protein CYLTODRAFT_495458 [Cylindrobasidium torrendii FP15055 ss-10]|uniref:F-box domain-containing protein n=1 Tax=Cylindrobasidium torrendii FP15055 ss-10 TaxID=1314674 RepID=A0A0D7ASF2_9AGAR|nr:hypothetical protein CYLTODRAFT_495458 [Cylindrobasidium torrendii FP15055 ss-10]